VAQKQLHQVSLDVKQRVGFTLWRNLWVLTDGNT